MNDFKSIYKKELDKNNDCMMKLIYDLLQTSDRLKNSIYQLNRKSDDLFVLGDTYRMLSTLEHIFKLYQINVEIEKEIEKYKV